MRKWLQVLVSFVGSLVALWLAHRFNIFDCMTFIPQEKSYDVCITVYFTLVEAVMNIAYTLLVDWIDKQKIEIEAIMFTANEQPNKNTCPIIRFNDMGLAEMNMKVSIKGKRSRIKNNTIVLTSMSQVEYQIGRRGSGAMVDNEGNYFIEIDKLCNNQDVIDVEETYKIVLQRGTLENSAEIMISPKLNDNKCKKIAFVSNEVKLTLEEI